MREGGEQGAQQSQRSGKLQRVGHINMISPALFASWQLLELAFYPPTKTEESEALCFLMITFQSKDSQALEKDIYDL